LAVEQAKTKPAIGEAEAYGVPEQS